jgi:outer membrane protein assembly factor BamB
MAGAAALAGCSSVVTDEETASRGGTTEGEGFRDREFGAHPSAAMVRHDAANTGAVPPATGPTAAPEETWSTTQTLGTPSRPTTLEDILYINSTNGVCGFTADGERRWAYRTNQPELNPSPPVVVRDRVYATRAGALFAVDAKVGWEWWVFTPPRTTVRLAAPAVVDDIVYTIGQHPEHPPTLWAVDRQDGSVRWQVELGGETAAPVTVTDGMAYGVTTNGGVYAVDTDEEAVAWKRSISPVVGAPAVRADGVYVATGEAVVSYRRDGTRRWRTPGVTAAGGAHAVVVVTDGTAYAAGGDGNVLLALTADTGTERWRVSMRSDIGPPTVTDEALYVRDDTGVTKALTPADGAERWSTQVDLRGANGFGVIDDGLVVGADGRLVRYG